MEKITIEDKKRISFEDITSGTSKSPFVLDVYLDDIIQTIGLPSSVGSGDNKVQLEWVFNDINWPEVDAADALLNQEEFGRVLTIYDWKEYVPIYEISNWHVGSKNMTPDEVKQALLELGFKENNIIPD
jgi:hypothetical protein